MVRDDSCACGHARPMMSALWKIVDARCAQLGLLWCVCVCVCVWSFRVWL